MENTNKVVHTIYGIQPVLTNSSKSKFIFDKKTNVYISLRPFPENVMLLTKQQLPNDPPVSDVSILDPIDYFIVTIEGIKQVYVGTKGGRYIYFDNSFISLKKLPEYSFLLNASSPPSKPNIMTRMFDIFKKKPVVVESLPTPTPPKVTDYKKLAKEVYDYLLKIKKYVKQHPSVFTRIERLRENVPDSFSDEIVESIDIGIAAISYPSDYPFIQKFSKKTHIEQRKIIQEFEVKNQKTLDQYIQLSIYYLYKDILPM